MITDNEYLKKQKAVAESILQQATKEQVQIVKNCMDLSFLQGVKVGMEEARKIYNDIYGSKPVEYDIEKCPECGSKKIKYFDNSKSAECLGCGATFI